MWDSVVVKWIFKMINDAGFLAFNIMYCKNVSGVVDSPYETNYSVMKIDRICMEVRFRIQTGFTIQK